MKIRGSEIVTKALEKKGARFAFGIPGTHNVELYDAFENSKQIEPVLVTDEQSASFMADGVSRTSKWIGVVNLVPGAGVTHSLSGIAEAFMDNVPLLVLACGIRSDTGHAFQLHDIDQVAILRPVVKDVFRPEKPEDIYPLICRAIDLARSGTPGPVAVEIPAEYYILTQKIESLTEDDSTVRIPEPDDGQISEAAASLNRAAAPCLYIGNGAAGAAEQIVEIAEKLNAPVTTTIQGKGIFPENHPLFLWNNFGASAPSFVRKIMDRCDCLLAVGCRFGEVATASYGLKPPANLIHVDINDEVFNRNYQASLAVQSEAKRFIDALLPLIESKKDDPNLKDKIKSGYEGIRKKRAAAGKQNKVGIQPFFDALQAEAAKDAIYSTDSGNGTFLAMEHLRLGQPGCFIAPVDYSCMGYAVPAAIGAKMANPDRDVIALAGDGALLMTGLELITAASYNAGVAVFVLRDGELSQIVQLQRTTFNRDTCSLIGQYDLEALTRATGCRYMQIETDRDLQTVVPEALKTAREGQPVMVDVNIDYSRKTYFTKGIILTNLWRLPWSERVNMIGRAAARRIKK